MAQARKLNQTVLIPKYNPSENHTSPITPKTPKTPADEAIDFFESALQQGHEPIRVYELQLDPDGGPNKDRSVAFLHDRYPHSSGLTDLMSSICAFPLHTLHIF